MAVNQKAVKVLNKIFEAGFRLVYKGLHKVTV